MLHTSQEDVAKVNTWLDAMAHRLACVLRVVFVPKANSHTDAMAPGLALVCYATIALMSAACVRNASFAAAAAAAAVEAAAASNAVRGWSQRQFLFQYLQCMLGHNGAVGF
jgi:hypothetical protein